MQITEATQQPAQEATLGALEATLLVLEATLLTLEATEVLATQTMVTTSVITGSVRLATSEDSSEDRAKEDRAKEDSCTEVEDWVTPALEDLEDLMEEEATSESEDMAALLSRILDKQNTHILSILTILQTIQPVQSQSTTNILISEEKAA